VIANCTTMMQANSVIVQKKWAVNTMLMAVTGFSLVLEIWVLWGFKMGFGDPVKTGAGGILDSFVCQPGDKGFVWMAYATLEKLAQGKGIYLA
jgi:ammonia channel protein AmtB